MTDDWREFDVLDIIERNRWPRVVRKRFFQINPLGQIRYLDWHKMEYKKLRNPTVNGVPYFMTIIGSTAGNQVVVRIPVQDLVKRYFNR